MVLPLQNEVQDKLKKLNYELLYYISQTVTKDRVIEKACVVTHDKQVITLQIEMVKSGNKIYNIFISELKDIAAWRSE